MGRHSKYPEEFRRESVQLVLTTDKSMAEIARDLGINYKTLGNWVRADLKALKRDLNWIYGRKTWTSRTLMRSAIFDYIKGFYNRQCIQKRLGYRSPADFESESVA